MKFIPLRSAIASILVAAIIPTANSLGADQPQWGQAWSRNMVSGEQNLPESFDPDTGKNIKWTAALGSESHSTPVISSGRVFIGTNNDEPRDPKHQGDRGVLMCLDERDGRLLWQLVVPKREDDPYYDWPKSGISSPATVEGNRVYIVSNRGEVMCLDIHGMENGNDGPYLDEGRHMALRDQPPMEPGPLDADIVWIFDLTAGAGIWSHDAAHSSILIDGRYLYLNTGTGVDNSHVRIRTPGAPSLVVLEKTTGRLIAHDGEQNASSIFHCTWSSPSLGSVNGRDQLFFAGGDGIVYAYETLPQTIDHDSDPITQEEDRASLSSMDEAISLKKVWQFDIDPSAPKTDVHRYNRNRREGPSNVYGMPVFNKDRVYVAGGGDIFWGKTKAWLKCIDATLDGDITKKGEVWSYSLGRHVLSTPAIHEGLVFIADCGRKIHCLDSTTGKAYWTHDIKGDVWASPYVADGKVYLGTRRGEFTILAASKTKYLISTIDLVHPISATVTAANGTLYVTTMNRLYAVQQPAIR